MSIEDNTGTWQECLVDNDYEIFDQYPYPIRRKGKDKIVKESINKIGYTNCKLNSKTYNKHRIIALQFIPNPDNLPQVDHINHNRADNRLDNLRWVSASDNQWNKSSYKGIQFTYLDELPDTAESLNAYNGHEFDGLYIDHETKKLYIFNGVKYRELIPYRYEGNICYHVSDIENKRRRLIHINLFG